MATTYGSRYVEPVWEGGEYGGSTSRWGIGSFNAAVVGDIAIVARIPAGSLITGLRYVNEALGTSVVVDVGTMTASASAATTFFTDADMAAAGSGSWAGVPQKVTEDTSIFLTIGGATTTASAKLVHVIVDYVFRGTSYSQAY